jgi:hypothetical protein
MIYLQREERLFAGIKEEFIEALKKGLKEIVRTFEEKAAVRDTGSPVHHRQSPEHQVAMAQAKCRRIESIIGEQDWEKDRGRLAMVREECGDAALYLMFISALCSLLEEEAA